LANNPNDDEYYSHKSKKKVDETGEIRLLEELAKKGYEIRKMAADGNCLFRSIADQVYGDQEMHDVVRKLSCDYMEAEREHFSQFVTEDINEYIKRKRVDKSYGNNIEIQAMSEIYNRPIEVYSAVSGDKPLNLFHNSYKTDAPPMRISYHNGNHYNSIFDPKNPAIGAGLGLPNFEPGLADKLQVKQAIDASEQKLIEDTMCKESILLSELQATEKDIEDQILQASFKEYLSNNPNDDELLAKEIEEQIMKESINEYIESLKRDSSWLREIEFIFICTYLSV